MLKELLPSTEQLPENQPSPQGSLLHPETNLLNRHELFKKAADLKKMVVRWFKWIIFLSCTTTLILLGINYYYTSRIDALNELKKPLVSDLQNNAGDIARARLLEDQINKYKSILNIRKKMSVPIERVYTLANEEMELLVLKTTQDSFTVIARSKNPAGIVQLIYRLLNTGEISQVVLKTAEINTATKFYRVELTGVYK